MIPPFLLLSILSPLVLPRRVVVLDFGDELGGEDVDLLVGAVEQAQRPELACRRRVLVSGRFGFLAAVCGLEGCDLGGLREGETGVSECFLLLLPPCLCCVFTRSSVPPSCGAGTRSSPLARDRTSSCRSRPQRWC